MTDEEPASSLPSERAQIRGILTENIQRLGERVGGAWSDDMALEAEKLQLQRLRTLGQLTQQYRLLAHDEDIDAMGDDIETLWDSVKGDETV